MRFLKKYFFHVSFLLLFVGILFLFFDEQFLNLIEKLTGKKLNTVFWSLGIFRSGIELVLASISFFIIGKFRLVLPKIFLWTSIAWIILFLIYVLKNAVNIPMTDDFALLSFLNKYFHSKDIFTIFMQYDEDREFFIRFLSVLLFHLHLFDFRILIFIASLSVVGSLVLLYRSSSADDICKEIFFLLLVLLLFQFQYYDAIFLTSGAMYHTCSIFFSSACFFFISKIEKKYFILAFIFGLAAVLDNGSGFITLLLSALLLLFQKRAKQFFIWLFFIGVVTFFFFHSYSTSIDHYPDKVDLKFTFDRSITCLFFGLAFIGSSVQFFYRFEAPVILGTLIWIYFFFLTYKKYFRTNLVIYFFLLFLLLTAFIKPVIRHSMRVEDALEMRYGIYSIMAIACCFISWFEITGGQIKNQLAFGFAIVFMYHFATNIFFYPEVEIRKERMITMMHQIEEGKGYKRPQQVFHPNAELIMKEAVHDGYYFPDY